MYGLTIAFNVVRDYKHSRTRHLTTHHGTSIPVLEIDIAHEASHFCDYADILPLDGSFSQYEKDENNIIRERGR